MSEIPAYITEGIANLIRNLCSQENDYTYRTWMTIGEYNYKVTIALQDVDQVKEAKVASILIKRED